MKAFSWSYSKLNNFEVCPRRYKAIDVDKRVTEEESPALREGGETHRAFANYLRLNIGTVAPDGGYRHSLPIELQQYKHYLDKLLSLPGELYVEKQWAITAHFQPTSWFGKNAWYRGIGDTLVLCGPVGILRDWKTGSVRVDETQLALTSQLVFLHYPEVKCVRADFVWLQEDKENAYTGQFYHRDKMQEAWIEVMPRVNALKKAHDTNEFPPKPNPFCRRCPVKECEYHG